jgi:hypothetical protein
LEPLEHARFVVSNLMVLTMVAPLDSHASPPQFPQIMLAWPTNAISLQMGKLGAPLLTKNAHRKTSA